MSTEFGDQIRNADIDPSLGYEVILDNRNPDELSLFVSCMGADGKPMGNSPVKVAVCKDPGPSDGKPNFLASRFMRLATLLENLADFLNQGGSLEEMKEAVSAMETAHQGTISFPGYEFFGTCEDVDAGWPGTVFMREDGHKAIIIYRNHYVDGPAPVEEIIDAANVASSSDQIAIRTIANL